MRKITFGVANSLDNFIARKDESVDWLSWNEEIAALSAEYWKTIDAVVMGRKTYEVALRNGASSYPGAKNYVFSRTMKTAPNPNVEIVSDEAAAFVRNLKQREGKGICVLGGGELAHALFEAHLIDEVVLNIHPVLLGSGVPLFLPIKEQIDLKLLECKTLNNGCVVISYRVKN